MSSARKRSKVLRAQGMADRERQKAILANHHADKVTALAEVAVAKLDAHQKRVAALESALGEIVLHIAPYRYTNPDMFQAITKCIDRVTPTESATE